MNGNILSSDRGVGAHTKHLFDNTIGKVVTCNECHIEPATGFSDPSHIDNTPGAEIVFGSLSKLQTNVPNSFNYQPGIGDFNPIPGFDVSIGSCSNVYCHGYFKNGNLNNVVLFTAQSQGAACGTCHGDPATGNPLPITIAQGGSHPSTQNCAQCHRDVVQITNGVYTIIDKNKHINGKLNVFGEEFNF
ncbi:MAG: CxxxxCH/CxxCH domain-containing protein [Ignavibacteriaceae bacterium]|nr:CxxxxCH/CxxCH domain-containing protein [Ignavibacteriaceae bacterium]